MAQGVPEKPELETRTFRPSSGAALTPTGFVDDTTKQKQFAAGLGAFSKFLQKTGELEQKRRVFNDKILAQTAIQLGQKNPAFLTPEGQLEFNKRLAGKAADEFNLKFSQHAKIHSRNLLGRKDISYEDKALLFNGSLDGLVAANVSRLHFNAAQRTIYGEKVLEHKLKLLNAFQEVNIEFVAQNTIDTQNSGMTQSFLRAAGVGEPD